MAELTADVVRNIVKDTVKSEFSNFRQEMDQRFEELNIRIDRRFDEAHEQTALAIQGVLNAVERVTDEDRDELAGIKGRLQNHNERIAKLERLNQLR